MDESAKQRVLDLVARVLEDIGSECNGVQYAVDLIPVDGGIMAPAVILKWDAKIHPKTLHDPAQAIVLENMRNGAILKDETIRRVLREKIEHMLKVDKHAHKELFSVDRLSGTERDQIRGILHQMDREAKSPPVSDPRFVNQRA
jgi:hypothetical protein